MDALYKHKYFEKKIQTAPVNWDTAFEDMAQSGDRAIPEMGLPIDGQKTRFMPSRERTIDQPEPGL